MTAIWRTVFFIPGETSVVCGRIKINIARKSVIAREYYHKEVPLTSNYRNHKIMAYRRVGKSDFFRNWILELKCSKM
jgi:hypothetical protein